MDINLTQPEEERLASMMAKICQEIKQNGGYMPFSRYMNMALYDPKLGYYSAELEKFGLAGDFITAPEISPFFGQTIVNTVLPILEKFKQQGLPTRILEFGAGTGSLAKSILIELHRRGFDLDEYQMIELSPDLTKRQQSLLQDVCHQNKIHTQCNWLSSFPDHIEGVILANEVLDAIPCERICLHNDTWHHLGIAVTPHASPFLLKDSVGPALSTTELNDLSPVLRNTQAFSDGYTTEFHPQAQAWLRALTDRLECGLLLIIDYGFPEQEYYHPQRQDGTLMAHYQHQALSNVLQLPGICDITCHIECSRLLRLLEKSIHGELFYSSQASYLLDAGITELVLEKSDPQDVEHFIPISNALQKLLSEAEMGELFKVIAFGKNLTQLKLRLTQLPGLSGRNRVY